MKLKIGLFLDFEPYGGGIYQYVLTWIESLDKLKVDVHVVTTHHRWVEVLKEKPWVIEVIPLRDKWIWKMMRARLLPVPVWRKISGIIHPLGRALKKSQCDLWIFPSQDHWSFLVDGIKSLTPIHDLMHIYEARFEEVIRTKDSRDFLFKCMTHYSSGVVTDSELGKKQVMDNFHFDADRIFVLPYLPPDYIRELKDQPLTKTLNLPERFIFYPAQFWAHKNHKNLFKAIGLLKSRYPNIHLVCVGSRKNGSEAAEWVIKEERLEDNITILGYVENEKIVELYKRAVAMVMPSFFGPTNIPPLEAMALGCPLAISNIYAMPEQVGDAALLFDPEKPEEIADCIEKYWTDENLRKEKIQLGWTQSNKWTSEDFRKKVEEIIHQIAGGKDKS